MKFADYTLNDFNKDLASDSPTPGGGSVAALSSSLSAALVTMVVNLTEDKLDEYLAELSEMCQEGLNLIDEDAESFNQVMSAFRLPRETEAEKAKRKNEIEEALKGAALPPLQTMKLGLSLLQLAREIIEEVNRNAISDIGVAAQMANTAIKGGYYNVLININSIKDEEKTRNLWEEAEYILNKGEKITAEINRITLDSIAE